MEGAFRGPFRDDFRLIETIGWRPDAGYARIEAHLARLRRTAAWIGARFDAQAVARALEVARGDAALRVRLTLARDGRAEAAATPLAAGPEVWRVRVAQARLDPEDPWLRVKTTERALYDAARAALPEGVDEMLFLNARGEVCEGAITSVFLQVGGALLTPPLGCGLLSGVLRGELLRRGAAREAVLWPRDLARGALYVGNSVRGLRPARLV